MNNYLIVDKETNQISSLFSLDGDYQLNTTTRFSVKVANRLDLDFCNYKYFIDTETGVISKLEMPDTAVNSSIPSLETTFE